MVALLGMGGGGLHRVQHSPYRSDRNRSFIFPPLAAVAGDLLGSKIHAGT
jgi:hypothetical protein